MAAKTVIFAMKRCPDNITDAAIKVLVDAWLATLTKENVYGWTTVHKQGFWEFTIIYTES